MTMADTVAVMNQGHIEQMGAPVDLYEAPRTTFVANFLGQSNLVEGRREPGSDTLLGVDVHGQRVLLPAERCGTSEADLLVGVRPEKLHLLADGTPTAAGQNSLVGGVVADASFMGVSTQYVVRMPWAQDLMVFSQNRGVGQIFAVGSRVVLAWEPAHTFALAGDAAAGVDSVTAPAVAAAG